MDPAIRIEGLWKEYVLGGVERHGTFYEALSQSLAAPLRRFRELAGSDRERERFWALRDLSLDVAPGEVLGVIGRNGAGKSTLLKILTRITAPTRGRITIRGRVASLLEVGTGFHPELTGRENVYLNGTILGMTRAEVRSRFDEIVEFAGVERFLDTPVKRYSSGMYVRLAFAVAAHVDADILLVDEVLAVGDAAFQQKCLQRMEANRRSGRTVLFVSHNLQAVRQLCPTCLWLDAGRSSALGVTNEVLAAYSARPEVAAAKWKPPIASAGAFDYEHVAIHGPRGGVSESIPASSGFDVELTYNVRVASLRGRLAIAIRDASGLTILISSNTDGTANLTQEWKSGRYRSVCRLPGHLLRPGSYSVAVSQPDEHGDVIHYDICQFIIEGADSLTARDGRDGVVAPLLDWRQEAIA